MTKSKLEAAEFVLLVELPINRREHIEPAFRERQERTVFATSPTRLSHGLDGVAWERALQSSGHALV